MTKRLLMGNEAIAHAALEAGVGVVAGYPGTPSSEIVETIARQRARGAAHGVHVEWSTNEKVALELLFGASLAGKRCLFTCKQMGLNVASDALMSLNYVSVRGGLVLVVADDPGPISSQTEQDTRRFAAFAKVPVLDPSNPEQAYDMVKAAFDLSERFHTPVIVRPTTRVDHASAFLDVADETSARVSLVASGAPGGAEGGDSAATVVYGSGFRPDPNRWVIFPRRAYEAHGEINTRLKEIASVFSEEEPFAQFNVTFDGSPLAMQESEPRTREEAVALAQATRRISLEGERSRSGMPQTYGPAFGIMAGGISAAYARDALATISERAQRAGVRMPNYRFMQVGTPYPFPEEAVAAFTKGLSDVLVLEELDYVLEDELVRFAGRRHASFNVHGKLTGETRDRGENDVDDITARIERFLGLTGRLSLFRARAGSQAGGDGRAESVNVTGEIPGLAPGSSTIRLGPAAEARIPNRPPVLCAGCPHRGTFHAVKAALGDTPAVLCGDIGCYTLGNAAPLNAVDTCLCMGGGVTMAQGIAVADPQKKAIAYIGDSTFFASGMTGLANAAYNGHDITVIVLDNATTAMTGAQPHPGTGYTLMGRRSEPLDIEQVLAANGFTRIYHANPFDCDSSIVAVRAAIAHAGPSAVVFEGACARLVPPNAPVRIAPDICTGCKRCITTIGCPAISFNPNAEGARSGKRGQATINTSLCVGCDLCTQVCPFKAIRPATYEQDLIAAAQSSQQMPQVTAAAPTVLQGSSGEIPLPVQATQAMSAPAATADITAIFAPVGDVAPQAQPSETTAFAAVEEQPGQPGPAEQLEPSEQPGQPEAPDQPEAPETPDQPEAQNDEGALDDASPETQELWQDDADLEAQEPWKDDWYAIPQQVDEPSGQLELVGLSDSSDEFDSSDDSGSSGSSSSFGISDEFEDAEGVEEYGAIDPVEPNEPVESVEPVDPAASADAATADSSDTPAAEELEEADND